MGSERILWLQLVIVLLFFTNLLASNSAQPRCYVNDGNYTSNSPYRSNLDVLLSSLSANVDANGFYNASVGQDPDTVYAYVLCRGDVQLDTCRSCIQNATTSIVRSCPNYKKAIQYNEFCTLRYSSESMFRITETQEASYCWNAQNASRPDKFQRDVLNTLLLNLRGRAALGGSQRKVAAAGNTTTSDSQTIFALVQCTPDLSSENCSSCLIDAALNIRDSCNVKIGCRVFMPSCNLCESRIE